MKPGNQSKIFHFLYFLSLIFFTSSVKTENIKDTEKLYDVLEEQTSGFFPPEPSYTRLSRVGAAQKHEDLLAAGVPPNSIKIVRVK